MKILLKYSIFSLLLLSSCSSYNNLIYKGNYKGKDITINFENTNKGYLLVDNDSIPFRYKIEKSKVVNGTQRKIKTYVYRFTVDAKYKLSFPLGLYGIGQKRSKVLQVNNSLIFVREDSK
jgi:hypothetical protein